MHSAHEAETLFMTLPRGEMAFCTAWGSYPGKKETLPPPKGHKIERRDALPSFCLVAVATPSSPGQAVWHCVLLWG